MRAVLGPVVVTVALVVAACGGSDDAVVAPEPDVADTIADEPVDTTAAEPEPPVSEPPVTEPPVTGPAPIDTDAPVDTEPEGAEPEAPSERELIEDPAALVAALASDELNGRDNLTDGSAASRELLVPLLAQLAQPFAPEFGPFDGYLQEYDVGTNIIGIVPGRGDLAGEYVMVGAHYDHLAPGECDVRDAVDDEICNGAADNAAGVASVMTIVGRIQAQGDADDSGTRSMIVAFWDGEEDGLVGAESYVLDPVVPLEQTVAYVNFDIQGASLLPAMANSTILVGPETGGPALIDVATRATAESTLDYATFSLIFGQGRSDHAVLVRAGVPAVFFTDANNGCYHTVSDDIDHYEAEKHLLQIDAAEALVRDLGASERPTFVADAPLSTYGDAEQLLALVRRGEADIGLLPDGGAAASVLLGDLQTIVDAGPEAYDDAAGGIVLGGAAELVGALADADCRLP